MVAYQGGGWKAEDGGDVFLTSQDVPQRVKALRTSGNLFDVLGVSPVMGRVFREEESFAGKNRVVILSYGLWQSAFAGDPNIVGKTIALNTINVQVIGVMPDRFFFPTRRIQLWIPFGYQPRALVEQRRPHGIRVIARLKPGVSIERAREQMASIAAQLEREYPDTNTKMGVGVGPFRDWTVGNSRSPIDLLLGAVAILLLTVCVNLANLQLSRGLQHAREIQIRTALGASRGQIARQLLTESLLLSLAGGGLGLALAAGLHTVLLRVAAGSLPLLSEVRLDWTVAAFNLVVSLAVPFLFGLVPAYSSEGVHTLADRTHAASRRGSKARSWLIGAEIAFSVILVVGAGLLVESVIRLQSVNPGFQADRATSFHISFSTPRYRDPKEVITTVDRLVAQLKSDPRVVEAGVISALPLEGSSGTGVATIEGRPPDDFERNLWHKSVTPGYFKAMGIPLLHGRLLDAHDGGPGRPPVTLINEAFARRWYPQQDAVGKRITFGRPTEKDEPWVTIVGVVTDSRQSGLGIAAAPEVYLPFADDVENTLGVVVRGSADPSQSAGLIRAGVHQVDPALVATEIMPVSDLLASSVKQERFRSGLLSSFAAMALLLAAIGIYGVLSYSISQRTREIGLRIAVGARAAQVVRMVIGQGMTPVVFGVLAGLCGAFAAARWIRALLFGVGATDPPIYLAAVGTMLLVAICACYVPASRASRVDPATALRND
jgi:predicted permease